jgi:hypothetical protein
MKNRIVTYVNPERSVKVLNRLFAKLDCSLARYLSHARPWARRPYMLLDALARRLNYEHEASAGEIARLIAARRGAVDSCVFPVDFTYYNDLSLEFLGPKLLEHERALIGLAQECVEELAHDPEANRLVKKLIASLRRYAGLLEELLAPHRLSAPVIEEERAMSLYRAATASTLSKRGGRVFAEPQTAA